MKTRLSMLLTCLCTLLFSGCAYVNYSFSGTSIDTDVKTVTVNYFGYKALKVNPTLSNDLTEAMRDKFKKLTKLEEVEMDGDLEIEAEVTGYEVRAASVSADEVAERNRLTVSVKLKFTNRKHPEEDLEKSFSAFADYDSTNSLDAVEASLCEEIVEKLAEDMFNACVAQW